ncbi:dihydrodipicolinate synthase family protein [Nocardioides sp. GXZ039]|uniref:dihydrodipicolinate synthase family protein n=1 Tax=Nocardioides sp. GXZ039 TaxID=3136018 RepID=UPI0030F4445C
MSHLGIRLPGEPGQFTLSDPTTWSRPERPLTSRTAFAAAHVVPEVLSDTAPGAPASLDWDATLAYRHDIWSYGLGVADAMDTAQRGMGLDWPATRELVQRSAKEAAGVGGLIACGAGTDQLSAAEVGSGRAALARIVDAYKEQIDTVAGAGAQVIVMASRDLCRVAESAADYDAVYDEIIGYAPDGVILHWLGDMFDPALSGYWGSTDVGEATRRFEDLVGRHAAKVDGVKISLLDADHEKAVRAGLPESVRLYTGDDYNYPELILGDDEHHSDALLGIFAAIYPAASQAFQALDRGDAETARAILDSTVPLAKHIFAAPTRFYKTGIAFLSYLNGKQPGFVMVGGLQSGRSLTHLVETFTLADRAGLLADPELARDRMEQVLQTSGWTAS